MHKQRLITVMGALLAACSFARGQAAKVYIKLPATGLTNAEKTTIFNAVKAKYAFLGADISFSTAQAGTNLTVCLGNTTANPAGSIWGNSDKKAKTCDCFLKEFTADAAVTGKLTRAQQLTAAADTMAHELGHLLCATHNWNAPAKRKGTNDKGVSVTGNGNAVDLMTNGGKVSVTERGGGRSFNVASQNQIKNGIKMLKAGKSWDLKVPDAKNAVTIIGGSFSTFRYEDTLDPTEFFRNPPDVDIVGGLFDTGTGLALDFDMGFISIDGLFVPAITDDQYDPQGLSGFYIFNPGETPTFAIGGEVGTPFENQFFEPLDLTPLSFGCPIPGIMADSPFPGDFAQCLQLEFDIDNDLIPDMFMQLDIESLATTHGFFPVLPQPCSRADLTTTNNNPGDLLYGIPDVVVNGADLSFYVEFWLLAQQGCIECEGIADMTTTNTNPGDPGYGIPDGSVNGGDLSFFVELWLQGCP